VVRAGGASSAPAERIDASVGAQAEALESPRNEPPRVAPMSSPLELAATDSKLLIDYWRAELQCLQARLDRSDSKAAGIMTACVAVAGASATGVAALHEELTAASILVLALGGLLLLASALRAVTARDTADRPARWWKLINVSLLKRGVRTQAILDARRDLKGDLQSFEPEPPSAVAEAIARSLRARALAAQTVADYTDGQVGLASALLFVGVVLVTLGVVFDIAGVWV
jgi:hypothetical protein